MKNNAKKATVTILLTNGKLHTFNVPNARFAINEVEMAKRDYSLWGTIPYCVAKLGNKVIAKFDMR